MIEAVMIWNEPNDNSPWDLENDPGWAQFARMAVLAGKARGAKAPGLLRVPGGIPPIDPDFIRRMDKQGVLRQVEAVAVHGLALDRPLWPSAAWPATTRHKEAEESSYDGRFPMGRYDEHGRPEQAAHRFADTTPKFCICKRFYLKDHRLEDAARIMRALETFDATAMFCFTPEEEGQWPHHSSAPQAPERFAAFCAMMIRRTGPGCRMTAMAAH